VELRVTEVQPFGGPVFIEVDGKKHALGGELAEKMRVEPAGSA
jgi:Fe2+ transport system protein FeoA